MTPVCKIELRFNSFSSGTLRKKAAPLLFLLGKKMERSGKFLPKGSRGYPLQAVCAEAQTLLADLVLFPWERR